MRLLVKYDFLTIYLHPLGIIVQRGHLVGEFQQSTGSDIIASRLLLNPSAVVVLSATGRTMMDRGGVRTGAVVDVFVGTPLS